jgi:hypothetical protein
VFAVSEDVLRLIGLSTLTMSLSPAQPFGVGLTDSVPRLGPELVILEDAYGIWLAKPWDEGSHSLMTRGFPAPRPGSRTWVARVAPGDGPGAMTVVWGQAESEYETRFTSFDLDPATSPSPLASSARATRPPPVDQGDLFRSP